MHFRILFSWIFIKHVRVEICVLDALNDYLHNQLDIRTIFIELLHLVANIVYINI